MNTDNYLKSRCELRLWNIAGDKVVRTVPDIIGGLEAISRDNTRAVTLTGVPRKAGRITLGTDQQEFIVWDLLSGKEITRLKGLTGSYLSNDAAVFSPDGSKFAASSSDGIKPPDILVWDTHSGALLQSLNAPAAAAHTDIVDMLAFSPDGARLASAGRDGQAIVWDIAGGKILHKLPHNEATVSLLAFTPDGAQLITGSTLLGKRSASALGCCQRDDQQNVQLFRTAG